MFNSVDDGDQALMGDGPKTEKSRATRAKIVEVALRLFTEQGFDKTTMRMIAAEAGVSTGNAYHYFASKEALMQGYYEDLAGHAIAAARAALESQRTFADRLIATAESWVEVARPFHTFGGSFLRFAADPDSAVSPFSAESAQPRQAMIGLYEEVIAGAAKVKMAPELRNRLPQLLWMWHMGVVLFWVHDRSPGQTKTQTLIRRTAPLIDQLVSASRLPVLRKTAVSVLDTIDEVIGSVDLVPPADDDAPDGHNEPLVKQTGAKR